MYTMFPFLPMQGTAQNTTVNTTLRTDIFEDTIMMMIHQCCHWQLFRGLCPSLTNDAAVSPPLGLCAVPASVTASLHLSISSAHNKLSDLPVTNATNKHLEWKNTTCTAKCPHLTPITKHKTETLEGLNEDEVEYKKKKKWRTTQLMPELLFPSVWSQSL